MLFLIRESLYLAEALYKILAFAIQIYDPGVATLLSRSLDDVPPEYLKLK